MIHPVNSRAWRCYGAELFGTFVLVIGGVGSAVLAGEFIGPLGVSLAFGLSLLSMVYAIGHISGCHINPAVTLGLFLAKKIKGRLAVGYVLAQIVGAILASAVLAVIVSGAPEGYVFSQQGFGANGYGVHSPGGYSLFSALLTEIVLTFVLVLTVLGATESKAPVGFAGIAIGLVLTLVHLVGIPVTNVSVNPARSIGPALFVGGWALSQLWLFFVAPLLGAAAATGVYFSLRDRTELISARKAEQSLKSEQQERRAG